MAKKPVEPQTKSPPAAKVTSKTTSNGAAPAAKIAPPPSAKVRKREVDDDEYVDPIPLSKTDDGPEFDAKGRRISKKKVRRKRLIGNIMIAVLIFAIFGTALGFLFWSMKNPPPDPDMVVFIPAKSTYIYGMHVKEARYHEKFRSKIDGALPNAIPAYMKQVMAQLKLRFIDLERVIVASDVPVPAMALGNGRGAQGSSIGVTAILKLRTTMYPTDEQLNQGDEGGAEIEFSKKAIQEATNSEEVKGNGKSYFRARTTDGASYSYYLASRHEIVICDNENTMQELLKKSDSEVVISGTIKDMVDKLGGENFWYVIMPPRNSFGDMRMLAGMRTIGASFIGEGELPEMIGYGYGGGVYGKKVHMAHTMVVNDAALAEGTKTRYSDAMTLKNVDIKSLMKDVDKDKLSKDQQLLVDSVENASVSTSGNLFTFSTKVGTSLMVDVMEEGVKVGDQIIRMPLPFLNGPFAGLDQVNMFGGGFPGGGGGFPMGPMGPGGPPPGPGGPPR